MQTVYEAARSGGYWHDGTIGGAINWLAVVALVVAAALAIVLRGRVRGRPAARIALGAAMIGSAVVAVVLYWRPVMDGRAADHAQTRTGAVTSVAADRQSFRLDATAVLTPCAGGGCPQIAAGDSVQVRYVRDADAIRALSVTRLPPVPSPAPSPAPAKAPSPSSTTSSGGLTIRLIPGRIGK